MKTAGKSSAGIKFLQIGDGPSLRGFINDWMNSAAGGVTYEGSACLSPATEEQRRLIEHKGRYALYTTGIGRNGQPDKKQIRCLKNAYGPEEWPKALETAVDAELQHILTDASDEEAVSPANDDRSRPRSLAGRILAILLERYKRHRSGVTVLCLEPVAHSAQRLRLAIAALAAAWALPGDFFAWLEAKNTFISCYAFRSVSVAALEGDESETVLQAEGFGRLFVENEALPPFFLPIKETGREIIVSVEADCLVKEQMDVSSALLWCVGLIAQAYDLDAFNAPLGDEHLRAWMANLMLHEYLPFSVKGGALELLADAMERTENVYFRIPVPSAGLDYVSLFSRLMLPVLKEGKEGVLASRRIVLMMALMVMEGIRMQDKRFHALSSDMEPETLVYAVLSDQSLWDADLRSIEGLEEALTGAVRDLQLLGLTQSLT